MRCQSDSALRKGIIIIILIMEKRTGKNELTMYVVHCM